MYIQYSEFSGQTLFVRASASFSNPECKKCIQCSEKCQVKFCFRASAKLLKNPECNNQSNYRICL